MILLKWSKISEHFPFLGKACHKGTKIYNLEDGNFSKIVANDHNRCLPLITTCFDYCPVLQDSKLV